MSITRTVTIFCDGEDCLHWAGETVGTAADARAIAKSQGWVRRGGHDLCPPCASQSIPPGRES